MEELEVGNKVTWVSQSQGFRKVKTGVVVKIYEPNSWIPSSEISTKYKVMFDYGYQIKKSYLVEVIESKKSKPKLYKPILKHLRKAD